MSFPAWVGNHSEFIVSRLIWPPPWDEMISLVSQARSSGLS